MKIVYSLSANRDLENIYTYIAVSLRAPEAARNLLEKITEGVRTLSSLPERGALIKEEPWYSRELRFIPVKKYMIIYETKNEEVRIHRIVYGGRNIRMQLEETDE